MKTPINNKNKEHISLQVIRDKLNGNAELLGGSDDSFIEIHERCFDCSDEKKLACLYSPYPAFERATEATKKDVLNQLTQIYMLEHGGEGPATDVFFVDERGRRCINYEILLLSLLDTYTFKTLSDTEQILVYQEGIYIDASVIIKGFIEKVLGTDTTSYIVREQIGHVQRRFYTDRDLFNADKNAIPLRNGLLNLETFELEHFNPERMYMFQLPGKFDESASYEATERFFKDVLHEEDIPILQEFFGYCLVADLPAHKMMWLIGEGRNGKSTTGNLLKALIGEQNTSAVQLNELDGEHRFSYVGLFGKLLNLVPEPPTKYGLQTPLIKAATGGDTIRGEIKGVQKPVNFKNFAKFLIYANDIPRIHDRSSGFWDRAIAIHYPNQFVGGHETKDIYKKILKSDGLEGLLNWAIIGLKRLQENNFEFTSSKWQEETKRKMERSSQPIETFLEECCTTKDPNVYITKDEIYSAYQEYCTIFKLRVLSHESFANNLRRSTQIVAERIMVDETRIRIWRGIQLKLDVKDFGTLATTPTQQTLSTLPSPTGKIDTGNKGLNWKRSKDSHIVENYSEKEGLPGLLGRSTEQGLCERCGEERVLTHKYVEEGGTSLICATCARELQDASLERDSNGV